MRSNIVASAYSLMTTKGIRATCIQDICEKADISAVTLYKYFRSKEEIAREVTRRLYSARFRESLAITKDSESTFPQKVHNLLGYLIDVQHEKAPDISHEFSGVVEDSAQIKKTIDEWHDELWRELIGTGRQEGYISQNLNDRALQLYIDVFTHYIEDGMHLDAMEEQRSDIETMLIFGVEGKR